MSTTGKVLSVLAVLLAMACVVLAATVDELNRNGTRAVDALKKQVDKLEVEVRVAAQQLEQVKSEIQLEQVKTDNDLTQRQVSQSIWEKARSEGKETLTRVQLQLADAEVVLKTGNTHKEERESEKAAETKALADVQTEVEALKTEREKLLARLTTLRDKFRATLRENQALVERLRKSTGAAAPVSALSVAPPVIGD